MTATDELRRMLDERGVEWSTNETLADCWTRWSVGKFRCTTTEINGTFAFTVGNCTPAKAIEATLGRGTCKNIHEPPKDTTFWPAPHFKCSECGATHVSMDYVYYCPNCGRKVVEA